MKNFERETLKRLNKIGYKYLMNEGDFYYITKENLKTSSPTGDTFEFSLKFPKDLLDLKSDLEHEKYDEKTIYPIQELLGIDDFTINVLKKLSDLGYNYIVRDRDESVFASTSKPTKYDEGGFWENISDYRIIDEWIFECPFVSWEDDKPFNINEIV